MLQNPTVHERLPNASPLAAARHHSHSAALHWQGTQREVSFLHDSTVWAPQDRDMGDTVWQWWVKRKLYVIVRISCTKASTSMLTNEIPLGDNNGLWLFWVLLDDQKVLCAAYIHKALLRCTGTFWSPCNKVVRYSGQHHPGGHISRTHQTTHCLTLSSLIALYTLSLTPHPMSHPNTLMPHASPKPLLACVMECKYWQHFGRNQSHYSYLSTLPSNATCLDA